MAGLFGSNARRRHRRRGRLKVEMPKIPAKTARRLRRGLQLLRLRLRLWLFTLQWRR
jgi:hypothetical protein